MKRYAPINKFERPNEVFTTNSKILYVRPGSALIKALMNRLNSPKVGIIEGVIVVVVDGCRYRDQCGVRPLIGAHPFDYEPGQGIECTNVHIGHAIHWLHIGKAWPVPTNTQEAEEAERGRSDAPEPLRRPRLDLVAEKRELGKSANVAGTSHGVSSLPCKREAGTAFGALRPGGPLSRR
jgi:hypothetical protein